MKTLEHLHFWILNLLRNLQKTLQLKSSSNFHEWGYKVSTNITTKNIAVIVEVFDFSEDMDKVDEKGEDKKDASGKQIINHESRMEDYEYKGKIELQLTEVILGHIMDNHFVDDKIIKEEQKEEGSNSNAERPSMKIPGVLRITSSVKLGNDFKSTLEKLIALKLKEINAEIADKKKRANEKAELLEQGVFWCEEFGFLEKVGVTKRDQEFERQKKESKFRFEDPEKMRWRMWTGTIEGENYDGRPDWWIIF